MASKVASATQVPVSPPSTPKSGNSKYEDITAKCEAACKKLRKEGCKELCKALGYLALGAIAMGVCLKMAVEIAIFIGVFIAQVLGATILSSAAVPVAVIIGAGLVLGLLNCAVDYALRPLFDRAFNHFDRHEACQKLEFNLWNDSQTLRSLRG